MHFRARRHFLVWAATGCGLAAAAPAVLDETDGVARALGYRADHQRVDAGLYPQHRAGQRCGTCHFFQGRAGDGQGGCPYFGGRLVAAQGWCIAYAPQGDSGGH